MAKIHILLVDDHTLFRQGLKTLISAESDMDVAGEASNGSEAVEKAAAMRPDMVLMDVSMPGLRSFEAARQIRKNQPKTKVLFLTMYDDQDYVTQGMAVGASGYILKDCPSAELVQGLRDALNGGNYVSAPILAQLVDNFRSQAKSGNSTLTAREHEVLKMLAQGTSLKEIACHLDVSVKTVEAHKFNLMRKLDIHNKAQLVRYAVQKKIITIPNFTG
jgi:two-component system, NarL family, response regulator NreC